MSLHALCARNSGTITKHLFLVFEHIWSLFKEKIWPNSQAPSLPHLCGRGMPSNWISRQIRTSVFTGEHQLCCLTQTQSLWTLPLFRNTEYLRTSQTITVWDNYESTFSTVNPKTHRWEWNSKVHNDFPFSVFLKSISNWTCIGTAWGSALNADSDTAGLSQAQNYAFQIIP